MNHPLRVSALGIAALAALVCGPAQAAFISWGPASDITGNGDVSTNGSLVAAYNFGRGGATTVNGVLFQGLLIGAPQVVSVPFGGNTLAIVPERQDHTLQNFATGSSVVGSPFAALTPEYQALLASAAGGNFPDRPTRLTLGGLTIGQTYEFQAWFNDSGTEGDFAFGLSIGDLYPVGLVDNARLRQGRRLG